MEKGNSSKSTVLKILIPAGTAAASTLAAFLYGGTLPEILRMLLMTLTGCGVLVFALETGNPCPVPFEDSSVTDGYFAALYFLFLAGSLAFPALPKSLWPYPAMFVGLALFGGRLAGICSGGMLLAVSVLLCKEAGPDLFPLYFLGGLAGILLFSGADRSFRAIFPVLTVTMVHFLLMSIPAVLMEEEAFRLSMFFYPFAGTLFSLALLMAVWKIYCRIGPRGLKEACAELNDPESPLLELLKQCSKEEYLHAIHTAHLCDRIAKELGLNEDLARAGGYYHRIGILQGVTSWENTQTMIEGWRFPKAVRSLLKEYLEGKGGIVSKEGTVLLFADTVITSVSYLFSREQPARVDYQRLIEMICEKILESGELVHSVITLGELEKIKKILMEEENYYEFLR